MDKQMQDKVRILNHTTGLGWDYNNAPVFVDFAKVEQNVLQSLMTKEITTKEPE